MAKRTRVTTSVSTLVNDLVYLQDIARVANRRDFIASCNEIAPRLNKFVRDYNDLRGELRALKFVMLNQKEIVEEEKETEVPTEENTAPTA